MRLFKTVTERAGCLIAFNQDMGALYDNKNSIHQPKCNFW